MYVRTYKILAFGRRRLQAGKNGRKSLILKEVNNGFKWDTELIQIVMSLNEKLCEF